MVGMEAILNFNAQLVLGDVQISEAEARRLLAESEGLAFIKNRWVAVDREKLAQTLDAYGNAGKIMEKEGLSLGEAMRMQLMPERFLGLNPREIDHGRLQRKMVGIGDAETGGSNPGPFGQAP